MLLRFLAIFFLWIFQLKAEAELLDKDWSYFESPYLNWNLENLYEIPDFLNLQWREIDSSENLPVEKIFLLKLKNPSLKFENPSLFIPKTAFSIKVFCGVQKIYEFSSPAQFRPNQFLGWIFHNIPISKECSNEKNFYFLLYTEYDIRFVIPFIDEREAIIKNIFIENFSTVIIVTITFTLSIFFLVFSLVRKLDFFLLNISLFLLSTGVWLFNTNPVSQFFLPITTLRLKFEYFCLYVAPIFIILFFENTLKTFLVKRFKFTRYMLGIFVVLSFTLDFFEIFPLWKTLFPFNLILISLSILYIFVIIHGILLREWEAKILGSGLIFLVMFAIHDSLQVLGFFPQGHPLLMQWGLLSLFVAMSAVVGYKIYLLNWHLVYQAKELEHKNKILRLINEEKEELNKSLEIKVIERTQDLYQKIEDLHKLKIQQDADYYLTCILLKPLIRETKEFPNLTIQTYVKQYKTFEFRSKIWQLGGDIIITENLKFRDEKILFFFAGDAMGKSMQGAGGAIVAGTIINHVLNRNKKLEMVYSPQEALILLYEELSSIFLTFEGYMILTACFGFIQKNGTIFWINASQPKSVLYSERAYYIQEEKFSYEFGSTSTNPVAFVNELKLKEGDKFITGSDGKDDIEIKKEGKLILNQNENLFLEIVQNHAGEFSRIVQFYESEVNLIDDISILCITYNENQNL